MKTVFIRTEPDEKVGSLVLPSQIKTETLGPLLAECLIGDRAGSLTEIGKMFRTIEAEQKGGRRVLVLILGTEKGGKDEAV